jgi:protease I
MAKILCLLPQTDFDPTEAAVPWSVLANAGNDFAFSTETGAVAQCDMITLTGDGLPAHLAMLKCRPENRLLYEAMAQSEAYRAPLRWDCVNPNEFDALLMPGGHAKGMRPYLESEAVFAIARNFFERRAPVAAICHGVLALARAKGDDGRSILHGRKTTALNNFQEKTAIRLTRWAMGDHYQTYPTTVQDEVMALLSSKDHFLAGPVFPSFGTAKKPDAGFIVVDGNYVSARWPGDAYKLAFAFKALLEKS